MEMESDTQVEVEAFRRLYPTQYYERYVSASVRPDARLLGQSRDTNIDLGTIPTAEGSALVKLGNTTMLAAVKLEVMVPATDAPSQGSIAVDFQMPPICSAHVRPGKPMEIASVITEQLSNALRSSSYIDLSELSIVPAKAAWIAYLDVYCLDADGSLFDAALLACVACLAHLQIPAVNVTEDGKVILAIASNGKKIYDRDSSEMDEAQVKAKQSRYLTRGPVPYSLTCALYKQYIVADPSAEEETIMQTTLTVVLDDSGKLISLFKPGGPTAASTSTIQECIRLAMRRVKDLGSALKIAIEKSMEEATYDAEDK